MIRQPATIRQIHAIISGALGQAVKWGHEEIGERLVHSLFVIEDRLEDQLLLTAHGQLVE